MDEIPELGDRYDLPVLHHGRRFVVNPVFVEPLFPKLGEDAIALDNVFNPGDRADVGRVAALLWSGSLHRTVASRADRGQGK